jgi:hypothetical protein
MYLKYHDRYEGRERDFRQNFMKKKQKIPQPKKVDYDDDNLTVGCDETKATMNSRIVIPIDPVEEPN